MATDQSEPFAGYVCWEQASVDAIVKVDATSHTPGRLLAVHHPVKVRVGSSAGAEVTQEQVLSDLLDPNQKNRILPILGMAGTGKSHLVQWLRANLEGRDEYLVVYLPRSRTGLRGVLDIILDRLDSGDSIVEQLRTDLEGAAAHKPVDELSSELLDAMARSIEQIGREPEDKQPLDDLSGMTKEQQRAVKRERLLLRGLAEPNQLPSLLRDGILREHFLREDGPIRRFIANQTGDADSWDAEKEGFVFQSSDLPESDEIKSYDKLGVHQRETLAQISSSPDIRNAAAKMISEAMNAAIPPLLGLGGQVSLQSVFQSTRRHLLEEGRELVLLVEDLSRLQGVDTELLNAIMDSPEEDGRQIFCNLRVAIAVTTGYWNRVPEGLRRRAGFIGNEYVLDVQFGDGSDQWRVGDLAEFTSRYLNAVRVGSDVIEQEYQTALPEDRLLGGFVPNKCDDCLHKEACHAAFGDVDGVGLYPFNSEALANTARAVFKTSARDTGEFLPSRLLGKVIHRTLFYFREDIEERRFPSDSFIGPYKSQEETLAPVPNLVGSALTDLPSTPESSRREALLRIWGGTHHQLVDLHPGIHAAFGIPAVGTTLPPPPPPGPIVRGGTEPPVRGGTEPPPPPPPESTDLEKWANGEGLGSNATKVLQGWLYESVVDRLNWGVLGVDSKHSFLVGHQNSLVLNSFSFLIEGQQGVVTPKTAVTFDLQRASHQQFLLYFERSKLGAKGKASLISQGVEAYSTVTDELDRMAAEVSAAIRKVVSEVSSDAPVTYLARRLALEALTSGRVPEGGSAAGLAALSLAKARPLNRTAESKWDQLRQKLLEKHDDLRESVLALANYRQGNGQRSIVRVGRLTAALVEAPDDWKIPRRMPALPDRLERDLESITDRSLNEAVVDETARLSNSAQRLMDLLGEPPWDLVTLTEQLHESVDAAVAANALPGNPQQLRQLIDGISESNIGPISIPSVDGALADRLAVCGRGEQSGLNVFVTSLVQIHEVVKESLRALTEQRKALGDIGADNPQAKTGLAAQNLHDLIGDVS